MIQGLDQMTAYMNSIMSQASKMKPSGKWFVREFGDITEFAKFFVEKKMVMVQAFPFQGKIVLLYTE